ncbi:lantibiotic dehydratase [Rhodococcus ruber]|uniref:Lantibiotic dehydratase n=1 Tax=Rhodococcus ruber TaxID=1830 RepID=A0ABT4M890_9NOCA|nr:lantibiotic dehydratase [Rhodococcus ruber]MCZ4517148.1 lantibiotic dehydratase [Rhodococcus ruber]
MTAVELRHTTGHAALTDPPFTRTLALGTTDWDLWRTANLRSAGFSADGLDVFGGPSVATEEEFTASREKEEARLTLLVEREDFVTALVWQNRGAWRQIASPFCGSPSKRRQRLRSLALYWQRYCGKAETIGYFGPGAWVELGESTEGELEHGPQLIRERRTFLEAWAAAAIGAAWSRDEQIRRWLPPYLRPDVAVDTDRSQARSGSRRIRLAEDDLRIVLRCDGHATIDRIADELALAATAVDTAVRKLVQRKVLNWDARIPTTADAHRILEARVLPIADASVAARCLRDLADIDGGLRAVSEAGTPDALDAALTALSGDFERIAEVKAHRAEAKSYAARSVCFEDAARNVTMTIGTAALAPHADALALIADAARWFTDRLAYYVVAEIDAIIDRAARGDLTSITLAEVWPRTMTVFWGEGTGVDRARRELADRWSQSIGLEPGELDGAVIKRSAAELTTRAAFTDLTGTAVNLPHSPDLQFVAENADRLLAGDSTAILGEMHAALVSLDVPVFTWNLGAADDFRDTINAVSGVRRLVPLLPSTWERNTGRFVPTTCGHDETSIGFTNAAAREPRSVVAASDIRFDRTEGHTFVVLPDGRRYTLAEAFAVPLSIVAADGFKVGLHGQRTPRLEVDRTVVFRQTWRSPFAELALPAKTVAWQDFVAVTRWRRQLGLPGRVYAKVPGETKPLYLDLDSPTLVAAFVHQVRRRQHRLDPIVVTECLPDPGSSWLADAVGHRYVSEIRLQMLPATSPPRTGGAS